MRPVDTIYLQRIFNELDKNHDGLVSTDELACFLNNIGVHADQDEIELLVGKDGLDPIEFMFFYETLVKGSGMYESRAEHKEELVENDLRKAFRVFDLNDDGYISCEELQIALSRLGLLDDQDCKSMIDVYDVNSDGMLDFEEFKDMMLLNDQT